MEYGKYNAAIAIQLHWEEVENRNKVLEKLVKNDPNNYS